MASLYGLGVLELLIVGLLALIFLGPEQLPRVVRTVAAVCRDPTMPDAVFIGMLGLVSMFGLLYIQTVVR